MTPADQGNMASKKMKFYGEMANEFNEFLNDAILEGHHENFNSFEEFLKISTEIYFENRSQTKKDIKMNKHELLEQIEEVWGEEEMAKILKVMVKENGNINVNDALEKVTNWHKEELEETAKEAD